MGPYAVKTARCADAWIFMGAGALPLLPSLADPLGCLTESTRLGPQEQKTMGLTPLLPLISHMRALLREAG